MTYNINNVNIMNTGIIYVNNILCILISLKYRQTYYIYIK